MIGSGNRNKGADHNRFKHGMIKTKTYKSWCGMKERCSNPRKPDHKNYGERGIVVCDRWGDSFINFLQDMGECPEGLTLERKDNDKGYYPDNCVWATRTEQSRNRRFAKLNRDIVRKIREDREIGMTFEGLSKKYNISISHSHRVVTKESWSDC